MVFQATILLRNLQDVAGLKKKQIGNGEKEIKDLIKRVINTSCYKEKRENRL